MKEQKNDMNRRQFLRAGARNAAGVVLGTAAAGASVNLARSFAAQSTANPYAYDVQRFTFTDPKLVQYEQVTRFPCGGASLRRIAAGPQDRLYVAQGAGVTVFDSSGSRLQEIATANPARCVAVGQDGTVYAGTRSQIEVFDAKGRRTATWESPDKKAWCTGLAVGEKDLFVADSGNRIVLRFDLSGKVQGRIGAKNADKNIPGLIVPSPYLDVTLGRDGLLRVNNPGRHRVELYTPEGDLELAWGKASTALAGFCGCCNPIALAVLPDGRCVTCEKGLPRVKVCANDGALESVVCGPESFPENARPNSARDFAEGNLGGLAAAVDSHGRIGILDLVTGDVRIMRRKA